MSLIDYGARTNEFIATFCSCGEKGLIITDYHADECAIFRAIQVMENRIADAIGEVINEAKIPEVGVLATANSGEETQTAGDPRGVEQWIAQEDLVSGRAYKVVGFHLLLGIWNERSGSFLGRAYKNGQWILREESHWGAYRGTCKPVEIVNAEPPSLEGEYYSSLLTWLTEQEQELELRPL